MERQPNTEYILSLSYGKDSLACLEAIRLLGYPLDRIVHAEVWATDTIPADLPPMVEFKEKADKIILERYGIQVEHICAIRGGQSKISYESLFYKPLERGRFIGTLKGFPLTKGAWCKKLKLWAMSESLREADLRKDILSYPHETQEQSYCGGGRFNENTPNGFPVQGVPWCNSGLNRPALQFDPRIPNHQGKLVQQRPQSKMSTGFQSQSGEGIGVHISNSEFSNSPIVQGAKINIVQYLGIAADEPERIKRHSVPGKILPLVDIGWDEAFCRQWCEENNLLSPIYTTATRGGCWFCHNQGVDQLRLLRKNYPELWQILLKWDLDSPTTFKSDGHTVHDYDKRFQAEDDGKIIAGDRKFRWKHLLDDSN